MSVVFAPYRYVRRYLRDGWTLVGPVMGNHGAHAVLMVKGRL